MTVARTLYQKVWDDHVGATLGTVNNSSTLIATCCKSDESAGIRRVARLGPQGSTPDAMLAVADHNVPTENRANGLAAVIDPESRLPSAMPASSGYPTSR
jgi:3-isopropylmalate/(R)-2-methylmalate dehydratase large subunit